MKNKETLEENTDGTIVQFLNGSHSFEGVWFGDKHPHRKGTFWWRNVLNEWQEQNSDKKYSEEELIYLLDRFWDRLDIWYNKESDAEINIKEWLEQYKK